MVKSAKILLVEDNEDDVQLAREGFRRTETSVEINHVDNGQECMSYLRKEGDYAEAETPDLVLLDLNMPIMDGRKVLKEIGRDENLKHVPVVVLTTSSSQVDVLVSYKLGCNSYIVKPVDFNDFQETVNEICSYWFNKSRIPTSTN